ncbi:hypothetical protein DSO57_1039127 [Entomophthora muscae]|uniref:Uncharacterized protein n=1 Tax=Entomophthora muscae TaxID=34485 RepID=A0ACC2S0M1_9FUNG|nr:hypothetical protein DSO57_1039127 [Entomophthora muscae]
MWVTTVSGRFTGPAAVWFTNWAIQELDVTWAAFWDTAKSRYSKTFSPIVVVTVSSIMPGIVRPSKKAQKAVKPVLKLTKLTDLNQTVD